MARMFPAEFIVTDPSNMGEIGERLVYEALRQMPEDWTVIHNCWRHLLVKGPKKVKKTRQHITYEADFVVLIPGKGILVLEVKNWQRAKVENGRWFRGNPDGSYEAVNHDSPLNQAFLAMKHLRTELEKQFRWGHDGRSRLECRCMAVLLGEISNYVNLTETEHDAAAVDFLQQTTGCEAVPRNEIYDWLYLCGSNSLFSGLQRRIERLFCFNNSTSVAELDDVRRYLLQNLVFRTDVATATSIINSAAAPLTRVLPMLAESPIGVHVEGCAGSGKSTMLCCEAARLTLEAAQLGIPRRVLVLCFNYNLAEFLRVQGAMRYARVKRFDDVSPLVLDNFQTVVEHICEQVKVPVAESLFTPGALKDLCDWLCCNSRYAFDHIFVDEAQDFPEEWWAVVRAMLRPGGKLYLFTDAGQQLYGYDHSLPDLPVRLRLRHNLRNSAQIASFCAPISGGADSVLPLQGPEVEVLPAAETPTERAIAVKAAIERLQSEHYAINDIVVLTPWRRNTSLKDPLLAELVDFPADGETRENADERLSRCLAPGSVRVLGETIKAYKGLESPAVILTDIAAPREGRTSGFTPNEFYVACTRARLRLIIIPTHSGAEYIQQLI